MKDKKPYRCPHSKPQFCPLYIAAHDPDLCDLGCYDGAIREEGCEASSPEKYEEMLEKLSKKRPLLVRGLRARERQDAHVEQVKRNMSVNGIT